MKEMLFGDLSKKEREMIIKAREDREIAYASYSGFKVGSTVLTKGGKIISGLNIENAAYGVSMCAERVALFSANGAGFGNDCVAVAVVTGVDEMPSSPCGSCRQVISEHAYRSGQDIKIILTNSKLSKVMVTTIGELLPDSFGPEDLKKTEVVNE